MDIIQNFIPLIILVIIWLGSAAYFGRKVERHQKSIKIDESRPVDTVTLINCVEPTNYMRSNSVVIDGKLQGLIKSGETFHFKLSPGEHTIHIKIDWCRSQVKAFTLDEGQNMEMRCGTDYNSWQCLYMSFIKPNSFLYVRAA